MKLPKPPQRIKFDSEKAIEAAAVIARREGKRIGPMRLLKLLYIADRLAITKTGSPIIGSHAVAMKNGPLHSDVYDLIKGSHAAHPRWSKYFTRHSHRELALDEEPENRCLSRSDIEVLQETVDKHIDMDDWELSEATHEFAEWKKNFRVDTSSTISIEDIIDAVGRSDDKEAILQDMKDDDAFDRFFEARA